MSLPRGEPQASLAQTGAAAYGPQYIASMVVQLLAGLAFLLAVFTLFRFSMGLRWAKVSREETRAREEAHGRQVVAEIPLGGDEVVFLVEDEAAFSWASHQLTKAEIAGARLLLNGGIVGEFVEDGFPLPPPKPPDEDEGRERWDVVVFLRGGGTTTISCGQLREGVSRQIAGRVFGAVRRAYTPSTLVP